MAYFDRFDICVAYAAVECDYNVSGILQARPSNRRRVMSTGYQLHRMGFRCGPMFNGFRSLSPNGKEIYFDLVTRYGLAADEDEDEDEDEDLLPVCTVCGDTSGTCIHSS